MTLDEAIQHCKDVAKESKEAALTYARENAYETSISCKACGQEHEQLAEWLTELKQRREAEITAPPKRNGDRIRNMTDEELAKLLYDVDTNLCNFCAAQRTNTYYDCEEESCEKCVLAWLKQEVKTNDER